MRKLLGNMAVLCTVLLALAACNSVPENAETDDNYQITNSPGNDSLPAKTDNNHPQHLGNVFMIPDLKDNTKNLSVNMYTPRIKEDQMTCEDGDCVTYFEFKDGAYPSFSHKQALGGAFDNAGDLDNDGIAEIYFVPDWFTSNWTALNIYSLKGNAWKLIANGSIRRSDGIEESDSLYLSYEKRIIKHKGYFEILENVMDEEGNEKIRRKRFDW